MSGNQFFLTPNELLDMERVRYAPQAAADVHQNALMGQRVHQQTLDATDVEMTARFAQTLTGMSEEEAARAYGPGVAYLQSQGFAKRAPPTFPGLEVTNRLAKMGTPSEKLGERGLAGQDAAGFGRRWGAAGGAPGSGGGAAMAPAPPGAYGQGGRGSSVTVPQEYMPFYQEASQRTGIPVEVLIAQHRQESGFDPKATGAAGEIGIGQIHPNTARNPGYGMAGVDPATLRDPRTNINFAADYLRARGGGGNWADPEHQRRALAAYNGGGDPNYVTNVTRYLPAGYGGAPATRTAAAAPPPQRVTTADPETGLPVLTGGPPAAPVAPAGGGGQPAPYQVATVGPAPPPPTPGGAAAAPAALPPAEATKQAQATGQPVPIAGVDGLWALPNGEIRGVAPARPAQPPAATTQQPPQPPQVTIPPPPRLLANNLTAEQNAEIPALQEAVRRGQMKAPEADAKLLAYQKENVAAQRQYQIDLQAQQDKQVQEQRAALDFAQKQEDRRLAALDPHQGKAEDERTRAALRAAMKNKTTDTLEYWDDYTSLSTPKQLPDGTFLAPRDMSGFTKPSWKPPGATEPASTGKPDTVAGTAPARSAGDITKWNTVNAFADTLNHSLDTLQTAWENASTVERAKTMAGVATPLGSAWTIAAMFLKGDAGFQLGVLNGKDAEMLQQAFANPGSMMGAWTSNESARAQIKMLKDMVETNREAARANFGPPKRGDAAKPGTTAPTPPTTGGNVAVVKSDADFDALPSGTVFTGPDGKQRRKP